MKAFWAIALAGPTALVGGAALAQEPATTSGAAGADSAQLEEIVVTAQKRSQSLQDVPIAISVLSATQLQSAGVSMNTQIARVTPNLQIAVNSSFFQPYIRGVGTQYANFSLEPSVSLYLDDAYIPRGSGALFEFNDVERVEVLKGPQGTLYGRNATGGAIRLISADPTADLQVKASASYGRFDEAVLGGVVSGALTENDSVLGRVAVQYMRRNGYIKQRFDDHELGEIESLMIRAKTIIKFGERVTLKLSGDLIKRKDDTGTAWLASGETAPTQLALNFGPGVTGRSFYETAQDYTLPTWTSQQGLSARLDADFDSWGLASITTFRRARYHAGVDLDSTSVPFLNGEQIDVTKNYAQEFQASSQGNGRFTWLAGLYLYRETGKSFFQVFGPAIGPDGFFFRLGNHGVVKSIAAYADATYEFVPKLSLTLGARQTHEKKSVGQPTNLITPGGVVPINDFDQSAKFDKFTYRAILNYKPSIGLFYLSYSRGFKSGGLNVYQAAPQPVVRPEVLDSLELGAKISLLDRRLQLNGALFHYKYKDIQIQRSDGTSGGGSFAANAAKATMKGAELDVNFAATPRLTLSGGLGLLDSKYDDYPNASVFVPAFSTPACIAAGGTGAPCFGWVLENQPNLKGRSLNQAPSFTGYASARYELPLAGESKLVFDSTVSHNSGFKYDPLGSARQKAYTLLSAGIGWNGPDNHLTARFSAENLLKEKYFLFNEIGSQGRRYTPALPRTWKVSVGYSF